jgi:hypothetical protein
MAVFIKISIFSMECEITHCQPKLFHSLFLVIFYIKSDNCQKLLKDSLIGYVLAGLAVVQEPSHLLFAYRVSPLIIPHSKNWDVS